MLRHLRTAIKFFVYGLAIGLLFAPRSGKETRKELIGWVTSAVSETARNVSGGSGGSSSA